MCGRKCFPKNHHSFMLCCFLINKRRHSSWFSESCTSYFSTRHKPQATNFIALLFQKIIDKRHYCQDCRLVEAGSRFIVARNANRSKVNEGFGDRSGGSSNQGGCAPSSPRIRESAILVSARHEGVGGKTPSLLAGVGQ